MFFVQLTCSGAEDHSANSSSRIKVAVRVRPFSADELAHGAQSIISMQGNETRIVDPTYFASLKAGQSDTAALRQVSREHVCTVHDLCLNYASIVPRKMHAC